MDWYQLVKLVHFMGLIALFGFFVLSSRAGGLLRASGTTGEARRWLGVLELARPMLPSGIVMLTASGGLMAWFRWRGAYPFVVVGLVAALGIWAVWALIGARHLRDMRAALGEDDAPLSPAVVAAVRDPVRWATAGALNGAALGVLAVMTLKLGWFGSIAIVVVVAAIVATAFALTVSRQRGATSSGAARPA